MFGDRLHRRPSKLREFPMGCAASKFGCGRTVSLPRRGHISPLAQVRRRTTRPWARMAARAESERRLVDSTRRRWRRADFCEHIDDLGMECIGPHAARGRTLSATGDRSSRINERHMVIFSEPDEVRPWSPQSLQWRRECPGMMNGPGRQTMARAAPHLPAVKHYAIFLFQGPPPGLYGIPVKLEAAFWRPASEKGDR